MSGAPACITWKVWTLVSPYTVLSFSHAISSSNERILVLLRGWRTLRYYLLSWKTERTNNRKVGGTEKQLIAQWSNYGRWALLLNLWQKTYYDYEKRKLSVKIVHTIIFSLEVSKYYHVSHGLEYWLGSFRDRSKTTKFEIPKLFLLPPTPDGPSRTPCVEYTV